MILDGLKGLGRRPGRAQRLRLHRPADGPWGTTTPTTDSGSEKETPVTPRFDVSYQLDQDQMIYASAGKGYRIGGANEPIPTSYCAADLAGLGISHAPLSFNSDSVWAYELGTKGRYLDNHLSIDASVFWINWDNIQQDVPLSCGYGYTANLGQATSRGFDLQAEWVVGHGLTLSGNAGLTDARYTKTLLDNGVILAKSGDSLPTPEWDCDRLGTIRFRLDAGAWAAMPGSTTSSPAPTTGPARPRPTPTMRRSETRPATHYVTIRLGATRDGWDVSGFIDNLLNSRTSLFRYHEAGISTGLRDETYRPLTGGVTAAYRF